MLKAFRLSRTAKNAKDFKVDSMDAWRGDCEFAVLVCPYFQYPVSKSQIYKEALNRNVMLMSWEWLYIMLKEGVRETENTSLKDVWNQSVIISNHTTVPQQKDCFIEEQDGNMVAILGITEERKNELFSYIKNKITLRADKEIMYYEKEKDRITHMSKQEAIEELLVSKRYDQKIQTIRQFIEKKLTDV